VTTGGRVAEDVLDKLEEFGLVSPSEIERAIFRATGTAVTLPVETALALGGLVVPNFLDSALDLIGDILDPVLPGGAGSELRATAFGGDRKRQNAARRAAGLPPLPGGRRRRKVALTAGDMRIMHEIATSIGKTAANSFIQQRVRRG